MKTKLDLESWARKEHFEFFSNFDEPYTGVSVEIDCTAAYERCKQNNISFFLYYFHQALIAVNSVEALRYRIEDGNVYSYDTIHGSATINRPDGTFQFSHFPFDGDFESFVERAEKEIEAAKQSKGLDLTSSGIDAIHFSSIPWVKFTGLSHARNFAWKDSCPKISVGKMTVVEGKRQMPLSIHAHHALVDGIDLARFIDKFSELMAEQ